MPKGRPNIYNAEDINKDLIEYMNNTDDPYVEEFILTQPFSPDTFYRLAKQCGDLSDTIKALHLKQAMRTIRKAESGDINTTFAIFKLKQRCYGWTDKQEVEQVNLNYDMSEDEANEILKRYGKDTDS